MTNDQASIQHSETPSTAPAVNQAPAEKMISSSEVNSIVQGRVKSATDKGYSSGYDAARNELQNQYSQPVAQHETNNTSQAFVSQQNKTLNEEQVRSYARDEYSRRQDEATARDQKISADKQIASEKQQQQEIVEGIKKADSLLESKVNEAKERFPGIEDKIRGMGGFKTDPLIRVYASQSDDPAAMLNHLASNPSTYLQIVAAGQIQNYEMQETLINDINATIKKNKEAADIRMPNAPLSQVQSSLGSNTPNDNLNMKDLRKMFRA